ncbi:hypothetical protein GCM10027589_00700 [Actinocorallia lasiicapitis]
MNWRVPGYREIKELGAGAQGRAVLVEHERSGRPYVIKYVTITRSGDRERFALESMLLRKIDDPHVVRWIGHVDDGDRCAIILEFIDGVTLQRVLAENGILEPEAALVVLKGALRGLDAAHRLAVVHRDFKPANIMVGPEGVSKLVDFGIATLAGTGDASGTRRYMAPEQLRGEPATPAADVYSATVVFRECVTGDPGADLSAVPEVLRPIVVAGTSADPAERLESAADLLSTLELVASDGYGPGWEAKGIAALGGAAAGLVTAVSLSSLLGVGGKALPSIVRTLLKPATVAGATAGILTVSALSFLVLRPDDPKIPDRPEAVASSSAPPPITITMAGLSRTFPQRYLIVSDIRYPKAAGGGDPALVKRINAALRAPVDDQITAYQEYFRGQSNCAVGNRLTASTTLGLTGPEFVTVRYLFQITPNPNCANRAGVNRYAVIDLKTGKSLGLRDMFTRSALSTALPRRIAADWADRRCDVPTIPPDDQSEAPKQITETETDRKDILGTGVGLTWTPKGLGLSIGRDEAADCIITFPFTRTQLTPLLRPDFAARLP